MPDERVRGSDDRQADVRARGDSSSRDSLRARSLSIVLLAGVGLLVVLMFLLIR